MAPFDNHFASGSDSDPYSSDGDSWRTDSLAPLRSDNLDPYGYPLVDPAKVDELFRRSGFKSVDDNSNRGFGLIGWPTPNDGTPWGLDPISCCATMFRDPLEPRPNAFGSSWGNSFSQFPLQEPLSSGMGGPTVDNITLSSADAASLMNRFQSSGSFGQPFPTLRDFLSQIPSQDSLASGMFSPSAADTTSFRTGDEAFYNIGGSSSGQNSPWNDPFFSPTSSFGRSSWTNDLSFTPQASPGVSAYQTMQLFTDGTMPYNGGMGSFTDDNIGLSSADAASLMNRFQPSGNLSQPFPTLRDFLSQIPSQDSLASGMPPLPTAADFAPFRTGDEAFDNLGSSGFGQRSTWSDLVLRPGTLSSQPIINDMVYRPGQSDSGSGFQLMGLGGNDSPAMETGLRTAPNDSPFQLLASNGDSYSLTGNSPWNDTNRGGGIPMEFDDETKKRLRQQEMDLLVQIGSQMGQEKPFGTQWRGALHADSPLQDFPSTTPSSQSSESGWFSSLANDLSGWADKSLNRWAEGREKDITARAEMEARASGLFPNQRGSAEDVFQSITGSGSSTGGLASPGSWRDEFSQEGSRIFEAPGEFGQSAIAALKNFGEGFSSWTGETLNRWSANRESEITDRAGMEARASGLFPNQRGSAEDVFQAATGSWSTPGTVSSPGSWREEFSQEGSRIFDSLHGIGQSAVSALKNFGESLSSWAEETPDRWIANREMDITARAEMEARASGLYPGEHATSEDIFRTATGSRPLETAPSSLRTWREEMNQHLDDYGLGLLKGAAGVAAGAALVTGAAALSPLLATGAAIGFGAVGGYVMGKDIFQTATGYEVDKWGEPTGNTLSTSQRLDLAGQLTAGLVALGAGIHDVIRGRIPGPGSATARGAGSSIDAPTSGPRVEYRYGPPTDRWISADGSTNHEIWTTPDVYNTWGTASSKLDAFSWPAGVREVRIPPGQSVATGVTPGGQSKWANGLGGAHETRIPDALPPGSVGPWKPIVPHLPPVIPDYPSQNHDKIQ